MESKENNPLKEYDSLNTDERVYAVLGAVAEPVSKQLAIELSGINYDSLDNEQKAKIASVFNDESLEITEKNSVNLYLLSPEGRAKLGKSVDMKTVHSAIAAVLSKELEFD